MYTNVSTIKDGTILVSKPLKFFVETLQKMNTFYRPHRSHLINLSYIKEYVKKDGGYIVMENDKTVSISKDKKEEFLAIVQNI
jgi:two-component system LytT family response regulator